MATTFKPPTTARGRVSESEYELLMDEFFADTPAELVYPLNIPTYAAMRRDASVNANISAYTLQLRRAQWQLDGRDVPDVTNRLVADDMGLPILGADRHGAARTRGVSWSEHLRIALAQSLVFGHSGHALGADVSSGRARLAVLAERPPWTINEIHVDPATGAFLGVTQTGISSRGKAPEIPAREMAWYCLDREGANWAGVSMLRAAWLPWLIKREMVRVHATSNRRWGAGVPVMEALPGTNPSDAEMVAAAAMASAARAGEQAGAASPPGFVLKILGLTGAVPNTLEFIEWCDRQVSRSALMSHLELGQGSAGGSRALGTAFIDSLTLALETLGESIADTATRHIAARLVEWNDGVDAPVPRVTVAGVGSRREVTAESLQQLLSSGALSSDPALEAWVRREYRLPEREGMPRPAPSVAGDTVGAANRKPRAPRAKRKEPAPGQLALPIVNAASGTPDYEALQQEWVAARAELLEQWPETVADPVSLLAVTAGTAIVAGAFADLGALAVAPTMVSAVAAVVAAGMASLAAAAAGHAAREVAELGRSVTVPEPDVDRIADLSEAYVGQVLAGYATAAGRKALTLGGPDVTSAQVEAAVREYLDAMSAAPTGLVADGLGGALTSAQNTGRASVFAQADGLVFVAAEENDSGTRCEACTEINGAEFATWAQALAAYPIGGFTGCAGQSRCRGMIRAQLSKAGRHG